MKSSGMIRYSKLLVDSLRNDPLLSLVVFQFLLFSVMGLAGFIAWLMSLAFPLSAPGLLGYVLGHLERWTASVSFWGVLILVSGALGLASALLFKKHDRLAFFLGILAFLVGFGTNMIVARNPPAHLFVGALVGWLLLLPPTFYVFRKRNSATRLSPRHHDLSPS